MEQMSQLALLRILLKGYLKKQYKPQRVILQKPNVETLVNHSILIALGLVSVLLQRSEVAVSALAVAVRGRLYDCAWNGKSANKGYNHFGRWLSTTIILQLWLVLEKRLCPLSMM